MHKESYMAAFIVPIQEMKPMTFSPSSAVGTAKDSAQNSFGNVLSEAIGEYQKLSAQSAETVAEIGYQAMLKGEAVVIPGLHNWALAQSMRFTPFVP